MIRIANFGTRAVARYKANKGPKGVEQGCLLLFFTFLYVKFKI